MRIMIVEDEQRARRGLINLVSSISQEYEIVAEAPDGKRALEMMKTIKPDVVFTDIKMPYMDGIALIKASNALGIKTKFVIISAYEQFETARQAISLGVNEYLVKPVTYDEVEKVLKHLSNRSGSTQREIETDLVKNYPDAHPYVLKAINIIEKSYPTKICQEDLAQNMGVTQEYFSYLFHKDVGETFSRFLKKYRIEVAKTLLINRGMPKEDISYSVGFSDPKYFCKVFKEVTGQNVAEFLKTSLEEA